MTPTTPTPGAMSAAREIDVMVRELRDVHCWPTLREYADTIDRHTARPDVGELVKALEETHKATDWLLAELIESKPGFFPTKSPVWPQIEANHKLLTRHRASAQNGGGL